MAEGDRPPTFSAPVVDDRRVMTTVWYRFLTALARRILGAAQVSTITTTDVGPSAVSVTSADISALTSPLVTSADAATQGAGYVQADVQSIATLANELKTDVNSIVTVQNTDRTLTNELKADVNALVSEIDTISDLVNELKATVNSLTAALNE